MADEASSLQIDKVQSGNNTVSTTVNPLSAYLPLIFEVSDTTVTGDVFNPAVQAEVQHYDGSNWVTAGTIKKEEITVSGSDLYRFEISALLQTVLGKDRQNEGSSSTIITGGDDVCRKFRVKFSMIYTNPFDVIIEQEQITSSEYWVANVVVPPDNDDQDLSDWILSTGLSSYKFLTDIPDNTTIWSGEEVQLTFLTDNTSTNYALYYREYNLAGVAQSVSTTSSTAITNRYGIAVVNDQNVLSNAANMSKVEVWIQNTDGSNQVSEKKTFKVSTKTNPGTRIQWLNSLGGIDQYTFYNYKKVEKMTERTNIRKPLTVSYTRADRGWQTISSKKMERWTLTSTILTNEESEWLEDINSSVDVAINQGSNFFEPVVVQNETALIEDTNDMAIYELVFLKSQQTKTMIG